MAINKSMRRIIRVLSSVARLGLPHFFT